MARRVTLSLLALIALAAPSWAKPQARAGDGETLTLSYDGVLVVKVLDLRLRQRLAPDTFETSAHLQSLGLLSLFKKIDVEAAAQGRLEHGAVQPAAFHHQNRDGVDNRRVDVRWTAADVAAQISVPYPTAGDPAPTREQKLAAADPLTQLTRIALTQAGRQPCTQDLSLFDGRQLYRLSFAAPRPRAADAVERQLGLTNSIRCIFTFTEIAGFDRKPAPQQNQGLAQPLIMDLAQLAPEGRWVITAVRGHTPLGEARIQIRQIQRD